MPPKACFCNWCNKMFHHVDESWGIPAVLRFRHMTLCNRCGWHRHVRHRSCNNGPCLSTVLGAAIKPIPIPKTPTAIKMKEAFLIYLKKCTYWLKSSLIFVKILFTISIRIQKPSTLFGIQLPCIGPMEFQSIVYWFGT